MAETSRMTVRVPAEDVLIVGTGGEGRIRAQYVDGQRQEAPMQRDGADLRRLSGVAPSVGGLGLDGATVETTTPIEGITAGTIFKAAGVCELSVRADGRAGFNGGPPRGVLAATLYVQRLEPVGDAADLMKGTTTRRKDPVAS